MYQLFPLNPSIVDDLLEVLLMSSLNKTFFIVISITFTSVNNDTLSTYHTSNLNFSVQLMAFLP